MSTLAGDAYHPVNGSVEEIWEGFSWPCLFTGFLWYMSKGMWGWGIIALILAFCTFGISWLIFPFFANAQYAKSLLERGYLNEDQWNEKTRASRGASKPDTNSLPASSVADELAKLAALKAQGVLSDEEFNAQKLKVLSQGTASGEVGDALTRTQVRDQSAQDRHSLDGFTKCPECLHENRNDANKCKSCGCTPSTQDTSLAKDGKRGYLVMFSIIGVMGIITMISSKDDTPSSKSISSPGTSSPSSQRTNPIHAAAPPGGFRNLKWSSSPNARLKKYSGPTSDGITMYLPASFKIKPLPPLFDCEVAEEAYSFSYGKFYSGSAWFDGKANFEKVKAALVSTYGQPSFANEKLAFWKWKWPGKIEVQLTYQAKFSRTTVTFVNEAI